MFFFSTSFSGLTVFTDNSFLKCPCAQAVIFHYRNVSVRQCYMMIQDPILVSALFLAYRDFSRFSAVLLCYFMLRDTVALISVMLLICCHIILRIVRCSIRYCLALHRPFSFLEFLAYHTKSNVRYVQILELPLFLDPIFIIN